jgi:hypothetical protein
VKGGWVAFSVYPPARRSRISSLWQTTTGNTAVANLAIPGNTGLVAPSALGNGLTYFPGWKQVPDPGAAVLTAISSTNKSNSNFAIQNVNGDIVLQNPAPGTVGNTARGIITGPYQLGFDTDIIKRVKITESKEFEFRLDAVNILNHPNFGNPVTNVNANNFGQITTATGSRSFTVNARLNF